jgi:hypothetical protein
VQTKRLVLFLTPAMPKQRTQSDCVLAAVATIAGVSYKKVKEHFGHVPRGGIEPHETYWLMGCYGKWKRSPIRSSLRANEWAARWPQRRALLLVDDGCYPGNQHAVAAIDGRVFNPADGGDCNRYVREAWVWLGLFQEQPNEMA